MNNIAYNKAKEHLKDFTKFPSINDIVLLMEIHAKDMSIEFAKYMLSQTITRHTSPTDSSTYTPLESKILKGELEFRGEDIYEQFLKEQENEEN